MAKSPTAQLLVANAEFRFLRGDSEEMRQMVTQLSRDSFHTSFHTQVTQMCPVAKAASPRAAGAAAAADEAPRANNATDEAPAVEPRANNVTVGPGELAEAVIAEDREAIDRLMGAPKTPPKRTKKAPKTPPKQAKTKTKKTPPPSPGHRSFYVKWKCVVPLMGTMCVKALTGKKSKVTNSSIVTTPVKGGPCGSVQLDRDTVVELDSKCRAMVDNWPLIKRTFDEGFQHPCLTTIRGPRRVWKFYSALLVKGWTFLIEQKWVLESKTSNDDLFVRILAYKEDHFRADVITQINARMAALGFS